MVLWGATCGLVDFRGFGRSALGRRRSVVSRCVSRHTLTHSVTASIYNVLRTSKDFGLSLVGFRFVGVASAVLVLFALRAFPCVALRCLAFVSCVLVGLSL